MASPERNVQLRYIILDACMAQAARDASVVWTKEALLQPGEVAVSIEAGDSEGDIEKWFGKLMMKPGHLLFCIRTILLLLAIYIALFIKFISVQLMLVWYHGYAGYWSAFLTGVVASLVALAIAFVTKT